MRHLLQAERRFAHLADAGTIGSIVLRAEMAVQAEGHLQFVDWLGGDVGDENLVHPPEAVMEPFQPFDTVFDGEARQGGLFHGAEAGERGQALVRFVGR